MNNRAYSWIARTYLSLSVLVTAFVAILDPTSQHHQILMSGDHMLGSVMMWLMFALALAALVDVVINDWLPESCVLPWTHRHRHVFYMAMAASQLGLMLAIVQSGFLKPLLARYALDAIMAAAIASKGVYDHWQQNKGESMKRRKDDLP